MAVDMMEPVVSVLMSVYNGDVHLAQAIESIVGQTYRAIEFIIIDDASTDNSPAILKEFTERDQRIRVLRNQENIGLTRSLNKGLQVCSGEFIARQDADDFSHPERIAKQIAYFQSNPGVALLGSCAYLVDGDGRTIRFEKTISGSDRLAREILIKNNFVHGSLMLKRAGIDAIGFYHDEFRYAQDYDLILRISEKFAIDNLDEPLYFYRIHEGAISESKACEQEMAAMIAKEVARLRKKGAVTEWSPAVYRMGHDSIRQGLVSKRIIDRNINLRKGRNLLLRGSVEEARAAFWKAFVSIPSLQTSYHLLRSYLYSSSK